MRKECNRKIIIILTVTLIVAGIGIYAYTQHIAPGATVQDASEQHTTPSESAQDASEQEISKYADDMKFSGEPISYKARNGYCEGTFEGEPENVFVTSKEELQSCLSQYGTVYVGGEEGVMYEDVEQHEAEDYFNDTFFQKHTLAIEVHDGSSTNIEYCLDSVTLTEDVANININYTRYQYGGALAPHLEFNFYILDKEIAGAKFNFKTTYVNNTEDADKSYLD